MMRDEKKLTTSPKALLNSSGSALITSVIFVGITLVLTLGYLGWASHEKVAVKHRYAEFQAELAARTGIAETVLPNIRRYTPSKDTTYEINSLAPAYLGDATFQRRYVPSALPIVGQYGATEYYGESVGYSTYSVESMLGNDREVSVHRTANVKLKPESFAQFMYFTNREAAGGGAFIKDGGGVRRSVTFGSNEYWEGRVHSNDNLTMSDYGCPQFDGHVSNNTGYVDYGDICTPDGIFNDPRNAEGIDSVETITYPPEGAVSRIYSNATHVIDAGVRVGTETPIIDTLVMTEIEFVEGGYVYSQWGYTIPSSHGPRNPGSPCDDTTAWYHPQGVNGWFHHFDFPKPTAEEEFITPPTARSTNQSIIYVRDGQVLVHGTVDGRFTIATNNKTTYRVPGGVFGTVRDTIYNNIWLIDDIVYQDATPQGIVPEGSPNRLGLISGANIIVANTLANGAGARYMGQDIKINGALMALDESFMAHYWQNTCEAPWSCPPYGDGRGPARIGRSTGNADYRGVIYLHGSLVQKYRGYVKRNSPGPYSTGDIGYDKDYRYDYNYLDYPPPMWPTQTTESGYTNMTVKDYSVQN